MKVEVELFFIPRNWQWGMVGVSNLIRFKTL
jgi:hypothetical protein